jgi:cephalosporin hydroxylase
MKDKKLSRYSRSKEIIQKDGWAVLIKKGYRYIQEYFDKSINKIFTRFYTKGFHKLLYYSFFDKTESPNIYWLGISTEKCPFDMWVYQEMIYETKPEVIIETGTRHGGSALFFAHICGLVGKGEVITIDINECDISHPRVTKIIGSSVSNEVINKVKEIVSDKTAMVILDSDHSKNHVLKEMELYSSFVSVGNYLVVEDTNINGHPVLPSFGEGPMEAVREFFKNRKDFEVDQSREKFLVTFFPKGFLRRIKSENPPEEEEK